VAGDHFTSVFEITLPPFSFKMNFLGARLFFATIGFPSSVCDSNHKNWGLKTPTITRLLENRAHSHGRLSKLLETSAVIGTSHRDL
jgi:hypothetical protein